MASCPQMLSDSRGKQRKGSGLQRQGTESSQSWTAGPPAFFRSATLAATPRSPWRERPPARRASGMRFGGRHRHWDLARNPCSCPNKARDGLSQGPHKVACHSFQAQISKTWPCRDAELNLWTTLAAAAVAAAAIFRQYTTRPSDLLTGRVLEICTSAAKGDQMALLWSSGRV